MPNAGAIDLGEIHALTDFVRNTKTYAKRLKKSGRPSVLTVNGRAELVVQDAKAYQHLLTQLGNLEAMRAVQRGIADMKAGRGREMDEVFDALDKKHFGKPARRGKK